MTDEELAKYYDTHSFLDDYYEAKKNGDVIYCKAGTNPIEAMNRHLEAKRQAQAAASAVAASPPAVTAVSKHPKTAVAAMV